jgi:ABC-type bacteriocin/lantibiotic exporter with double-glycine peptidase domain
MGNRQGAARQQIDPEPQDEASGGAIDAGLSCLVVIAKFHGIPADPDQLRRPFSFGKGCFGENKLLITRQVAGPQSEAGDTTVFLQEINRDCLWRKALIT